MTRKKPAPKTKTPEPVVTNTVCSLCGENWYSHVADENGDVTTLECIRLLRLRVPTITIGATPNIYVQPHYPYRTWYASGGNYASGTTFTVATNTAATTPKVLNASAA